MSASLLVVDDSESVRQLLSFTLKDSGYNVTTASNGKEGLEKLEQSDVDMVITDLNMPLMNGMKFVEGIRARRESRFIPVVVVTTESLESKRQEARKAGVSGWITKPFHPDQLLDVIRKFVG